MGRASGIFLAHVGTLHSLRSFRRHQPLVLGFQIAHQEPINVIAQTQPTNIFFVRAPDIGLRDHV